MVILLGSAPGKSGGGSRNWASAKPNLLNVALTRAKQRVYIIGNSTDWSCLPGFDSLHAEMKSRNRVLDGSFL